LALCDDEREIAVKSLGNDLWLERLDDESVAIWTSEELADLELLVPCYG
jgi:hypothetical protein